MQILLDSGSFGLHQNPCILVHFQWEIPKLMRIGQTIDLGSGFWRRNRLESGASIDGLRGQNIPFNSKVIDRTEGLERIVSHKSTDVRLPSYRKPGAVYRIGMRFVRALAAYQGEVRCDHRKKASYHLHWMVEDPKAERLLEWFVPETGVSEKQEDEMERVVTEGAMRGIKIAVLRVPD